MTIKQAMVSGMQVGFPPSVGVMMTVFVDVSNPNGYDLAIRAVRGNVMLASRYPLAVDFRPPGEGVWLAADKTTSIQVPVQIPVDLAMTLLREAYATPTIPFHMTGRADVTASRTFKIEKDDYAFDQDGTISRDQIEASLRVTFPLGFSR